MEINGQLRLENIMALPKDIATHSPSFKKNINLVTYGSAVVLLVILFWLQSTLSIATISLIVAVIILYIIFMRRFLRRRMIKAMERNLRKSDIDEFLTPYTLRLNDEGLELEREQHTKTMNWQDIQAVTSDQNNYFLYITDESNVIIPKKDIDSDSEFRDLVRTRFNGLDNEDTN